LWLIDLERDKLQPLSDYAERFEDIGPRFRHQHKGDYQRWLALGSSLQLLNDGMQAF
jgi:hypothetical protein